MKINKTNTIFPYKLDFAFHIHIIKMFAKHLINDICQYPFHPLTLPLWIIGQGKQKTATKSIRLQGHFFLHFHIKVIRLYIFFKETWINIDIF